MERNNEGNPHTELADQYLEGLLQGKRHIARQLIMDAVESGVPVREIYLQVFQPSLHEIGRLWQINQVSVAQEHYCSAATQMIMSQLYPLIFSSEKIGRRLMATCIDGELHEIGVRMVADFFEMDGWDTHYLGANTPTDSIIQTIETFKPDILAISAVMTFNIAAAADLIAEVRANTNEKPKILVGGRPFNMAEGLWERVSADGFASDAEEAIRTAAKLMLF
ncbi:MAG: cobalamin B12-binding domain-containing protein [SAR324 cluster bacterium]|nr:cobalamin B12-binding domain-containing protein [SAR324 cluster bacterium]